MNLIRKSTGIRVLLLAIPVAFGGSMLATAVEPQAATAGPVHRSEPQNNDPGRVSSCTKRVTFSGEEFLQKLLIVANEENLSAVPGRFMEEFGIDLRAVQSEEGALTYVPVEPCMWPTPLWIRFESGAVSGDTPRGIIRLQKLTELLKLDPRNLGGCLSQEAVESFLKTDGWTGGPLRWEIVVWRYKKGRSHFSFLPTVESLGNPARRYFCLESIDITY